MNFYHEISVPSPFSLLDILPNSLNVTEKMIMLPFFHFFFVLFFPTAMICPSTLLNLMFSPIRLDKPGGGGKELYTPLFSSFEELRILNLSSQQLVAAVFNNIWPHYVGEIEQIFPILWTISPCSGCIFSGVVCPNFGHPDLTSSFLVYALCRCRRQATKIIKSQFES